MNKLVIIDTDDSFSYNLEQNMMKTMMERVRFCFRFRKRFLRLKESYDWH